MLALVPWLLERPGASLSETADAFGVEVATIRRDLGHLDFCGLPGLGGGVLFDVTLVDDRVVVRMADELRRPVRPTASEALRLVLTIDAVGRVLGDELPALRTAIGKVRDALGVPPDAVQVVEPAPAAPVATVRRAIDEDRRVRITYRARGADAATTRDVDPFALHVLDGAWYVQGHDHRADGLRSFRIDRIVALEVLDQARGVVAPPQLPPPRYRPRDDDLVVELELAPGARWVADAVVRDHLEEREHGRARLVFRTDRPEFVSELVLMAGGDAVVVRPARIAAAVRDRARTALARYAAR
jgi:proteasome accessory factor C